MNFIHISDVHLGAKPDAGQAYGEHRANELWHTFSRVITLCEEEKTDVLLIAGDLFHRQPLMRELKEVNYLFSTLSHTQVVLIAGNHDYIRQDSFYRSFQWNENVFPLLEQFMECVELPELELAVYGFSYHAREIRAERYCDKAPGTHRYEILLAHGGDEKHVPIRRQVLERLGYNYIALGHIHKPQVICDKRCLYSGALEPIDKNDTGPHGFVRGEIRDGHTKAEFVPFAMREYIHLALRVNPDMTSGRVKAALKDTIEKRGVSHMYKFVLRGMRDADVVFDTEHMDFYGNILEIQDETQPALDYEKIYDENKENLIGKYMELFSGCTEGSLEYRALQEGVEALLNSQNT